MPNALGDRIPPCSEHEHTLARNQLTGDEVAALAPRLPVQFRRGRIDAYRHQAGAELSPDVHAALVERPNRSGLR